MTKQSTYENSFIYKMALHQRFSCLHQAKCTLLLRNFTGSEEAHNLHFIVYSLTLDLAHTFIDGLMRISNGTH